MGCGKSSVGRRLASVTGHKFVDTDERVSARAGMSITKIFSELGEQAFRDLESNVLESLLSDNQIILATGGGIVLRAENRRRLHQIGPVIWLDAAPDILFERVSRNKRRPLLQTPDPRKTFDDLLASRRPVYEEAADVRVDSAGLTHDEAARIVLEETIRIVEQTHGAGFGS